VKTKTPLINLEDKFVKARKIERFMIEIEPDVENESNDRYVSF